MASIVSFGGEFAPFGLAIFAAVCSNEIPAGLVYIFAGIGTLIGFGPKGFLSYLLSSLIFIIFTYNIFNKDYVNIFYCISLIVFDLSLPSNPDCSIFLLFLFYFK